MKDAITMNEGRRWIGYNMGDKANRPAVCVVERVGNNIVRVNELLVGDDALAYLRENAPVVFEPGAPCSGIVVDQ